jgi:hypothetical protein
VPYSIQYTSHNPARLGRQVFIYNVDQSVGATGVNRPLDVKLVQTLFRIMYYDFPGAGPTPPPGYTGIDVDGKFGPKTLRHIAYFKNTMRRHNTPTPADGKIDPITGDPRTSFTPHGYRYVLEALNSTMFLICQNNGKRAHGELHLPRPIDDPVDSALWNALQTVRYELD